MKTFTILIMFLMPIQILPQINFETIYSEDNISIKFQDFSWNNDKYILICTESDVGGILFSSKDLKTWEKKFIDTSNFPDYIPDYSFNTSFSFDNGTTLVGANGGKIFKFNSHFDNPEIIDFETTCPLFEFVMFDENNGIINFQAEIREFEMNDYKHCRRKQLYITDDGWETYEEMNISVDNDTSFIYKFEKIDDNTLFAYGYNYYFKEGDSLKVNQYRDFIYKSFDNGKTWEAINLENKFRDIHFVNDKSGVAILYYNTSIGDPPYDEIYFTKDGGVTWRKANKDYNQGIGKINQIASSNDSTMVITGSFFLLLVNRDGGENWQKQEIENPGNAGIGWLYNPKFISENSVIMVNRQRRQLFRADLLPSSILNEETETGIIIDNRKCRIESSLLNIEKVNLVSAGGSKIEIAEYNYNGNTLEFDIPNSISTGLYFVELKSKTATKVYKVIIRE